MYKMHVIIGPNLIVELKGSSSDVSVMKGLFLCISPCSRTSCAFAPIAPGAREVTISLFRSEIDSDF